MLDVQYCFNNKATNQQLRYAYKTKMDFLVWKTPGGMLHFIWHSMPLQSFCVCLFGRCSCFDCCFPPVETSRYPTESWIPVSIQPSVGFHSPNPLFVSIWCDLCFLSSKAFAFLEIIVVLAFHLWAISDSSHRFSDPIYQLSKMNARCVNSSI